MDNNTTTVEIMKLSAHADKLYAVGRKQEAAIVRSEVFRLIDAQEED